MQWLSWNCYHKLITLRNPKNCFKAWAYKLKVFDRIEWNLIILKLLQIMNFTQNLLNDIYEDISTTNISIRLNQIRIPYFKTSRGIRQVGYLSPILFITFMDCVTAIFNATSYVGWCGRQWEVRTRTSTFLT